MERQLAKWDVYKICCFLDDYWSFVVVSRCDQNINLNKISNISGQFHVFPA